jgi:toxin ParE1/3/4
VSRYRLAFATNADLDEIATTIGQSNPENAISVLDRLHETFMMLASNPQVGMVRDDLVPGIRVFSPPSPAHNYVVFFYPMSDGIEVSAVIHGSRDWIGIIARGERGLRD